MAIDCDDTRDRLARIERMVEHYRVVRRRRIERRAIGLWRRIEVRLALAGFEKPTERVH